jgi:hypothetical protein
MTMDSVCGGVPGYRTVTVRTLTLPGQAVGFISASYPANTRDWMLSATICQTEDAFHATEGAIPDRGENVWEELMEDDVDAFHCRTCQT